MKTCIYTLSAMAIATSLSFAQDGPKGPGGPGGPDGSGKGKRPNPEEIFKKLDADADGSMTLDEFKKSPIGQKDEAKAEEIYKKIDANSDQKVTLEEFKTHRPPHRPRGPGGPGGPGEGGKGKGEGGPPTEPPAQ